MRTVPISELMRLSNIELCDLLTRIINALPNFPEGSPEGEAARTNVRNIRHVLACRSRHLTP